MEIKKFLATYRGLLWENRLYRWVVLLLLVSNLLLVVLLRSNQAVVLVPPTLEKEAKVEARKADRAYLEAWGLFFATLLGNVTPKNIDFVTASLQRYMAPSVYNELTQVLVEQARMIKSGTLTLSFTPQDLQVEGNQVKVRGVASVYGPGGKLQGFTRVYEFSIAIRNYSPVLTDLQVQDQQPGGKKEEEP